MFRSAVVTPRITSPYYPRHFEIARGPNFGDITVSPGGGHRPFTYTQYQYEATRGRRAEFVAADQPLYQFPVRRLSFEYPDTHDAQTEIPNCISRVVASGRAWERAQLEDNNDVELPPIVFPETSTSGSRYAMFRVWCDGENRVHVAPGDGHESFALADYETISFRDGGFLEFKRKHPVLWPIARLSFQYASDELAFDKKLMITRVLEGSSREEESPVGSLRVLRAAESKI